MKKQVKVEWCEGFIRAQFTKHHAFPSKNAGIATSLFWRNAEKSGLWTKGEYGGPMSEALMNLCIVDSVSSDDGEYLYTVFRLKKEV